MAEETWGESVRRRREQRELSQNALARLTKLSRGTIRNIEEGRGYERWTKIAVDQVLEAAESRSGSPVVGRPGRSAKSIALGYSYPPSVHTAVRQLIVSAETVLADHIADLSGSHLDYDDGLVELLLALTALPEDLRGQTAPELLERAEVIRHG